jgi:hypothetical protein
VHTWPMGRAGGVEHPKVCRPPAHPRSPFPSIPEIIRCPGDVFICIVRFTGFLGISHADQVLADMAGFITVAARSSLCRRGMGLRCALQCGTSMHHIWGLISHSLSTWGIDMGTVTIDCIRICVQKFGRRQLRQYAVMFRAAATSMGGYSWWGTISRAGVLLFRMPRGKGLLANLMGSVLGHAIPGLMFANCLPYLLNPSKTT